MSAAIEINKLRELVAKPIEGRTISAEQIEETRVFWELASDEAFLIGLVNRDPLSRAGIEILLSEGQRADRPKNSLHEKVFLQVIGKVGEGYEELSGKPLSLIRCQASIDTGDPMFCLLTGNYSVNDPDSLRKWAKKAFEGIYGQVSVTKNINKGCEIVLSRTIGSFEELAASHGDRVEEWLASVSKFLNFGQEDSNEWE